MTTHVHDLDDDDTFFRTLPDCVSARGLSSNPWNTSFIDMAERVLQLNSSSTDDSSDLSSGPDDLSHFHAIHIAPPSDDITDDSSDPERQSPIVALRGSSPSGDTTDTDSDQETPRGEVGVSSLKRRFELPKVTSFPLELRSIQNPPAPDTASPESDAATKRHKADPSGRGYTKRLSQTTRKIASVMEQHLTQLEKDSRCKDLQCLGKLVASKQLGLAWVCEECGLVDSACVLDPRPNPSDVEGSAAAYGDLHQLHHVSEEDAVMGLMHMADRASVARQLTPAQGVDLKPTPVVKASPFNPRPITESVEGLNFQFPPPPADKVMEYEIEQERLRVQRAVAERNRVRRSERSRLKQLLKRAHDGAAHQHLWEHSPQHAARNDSVELPVPVKPKDNCDEDTEHASGATSSEVLTYDFVASEHGRAIHRARKYNLGRVAHIHQTQSVRICVILCVCLCVCV